MERRQKLLSWWTIPVFLVIGWALALSCHRQATMAEGAEVGKVGSVIVWADSTQDRDRLVELSRGYTGLPITINAIETAKNESSLVEYKTSRKLNLSAPRELWPKIVAVALRLPHECSGECQTLFKWVELK